MRAAPPLASSWLWRLALGWLALVALVGLLGPWLPLARAAATPDLQHVAAPPDARHYLGTDPLGRDVLAGLLAGAQRLVLLTLPAVLLAAALGALVGGAAGYWGNDQLRLPRAAGALALAAGWWALALPASALVVSTAVVFALVVSILSWRRPAGTQPARWLSFALPLDGLVLGAATWLSAVPRLLLLVALATGPPLQVPQLLGLLVLVAWPEPARLVRAQMRQVRALPFIEAARASGLPPSRIWWRHALPAASRPLRAFVPLSLAGLIGLESSLAFLGIGQAPDVVSWGSLLATARQEPGAWWVAAGPGLALLLTLLALQQLGRNLNREPRR